MPISQVLEGACGSPEGGLGQNLACKGKRAKPQAHAGAGAGDAHAGTARHARGCRHTLVCTQLSAVTGVWERCGAHPWSPSDKEDLTGPGRAGGQVK